MTARRGLRIAIVAGEESGDILGSDVVDAINATTGGNVELVGVGGHHLQERGLKTLFDPGEISLMGFTAVVSKLPRLLRHIATTATAIAAAKPDCLITIDSPDFNLRVARKVRAADPDIPIVHYVCPSVWAWRPRRAEKMRAFVDHVLCILPFEIAELKRLDGPPATYVGHRLAHDPRLTEAAQKQRARTPRDPGASATLLVLPGSRGGEVKSLLEPFREAIDILSDRGVPLRLLLPTVPHVEQFVESEVAAWRIKPEIIRGAEEKYRAFGEADAALAASGTVSLELALARVPTVVCYKTDRLARMLRSMITVWSASLPNLIADRPVLPELYDDFVRPGMMARHLELLVNDTKTRAAQMDGFDLVADRMKTDRPAGEIAAEAVLAVIGQRTKK